MVSEKKRLMIHSVILLSLTLACPFPLLTADITELEATGTSEEYIVSCEYFEMNRFIDQLTAYDYI
jgi:hypothetical protein